MNKTIGRPKLPPKNHPVVAFDTETVGDKRKFVHAVVMDSQGVYHFDTADALRDWLTQADYAGHNIFAHNLAYDLTMAFDGYQHGIKPLYHNRRLIKATFKPDKGNLITFLDTSNHTGRVSLGWLGKVVERPKWETPPKLLGEKVGKYPWSCIKHQELYCVRCYCENDVIITWLFASLYQDACRTLGCEVKSTVSATGMDLWKRVFITRSYDVPALYENRLGRAAYFGGWTENDVVGEVENVSGYDVNSLYPFVHVHFPYPDPDRMRYRYQPKDIDAVISSPGVSECTVMVPDTDWPVLPVWFADRLYFPTGLVSGCWTHVDLQEVIKDGGHVVSIHQSVFSSGTCQPLAYYMSEVYKFRQRYLQDGNPFQVVVKLLMNGLTGKFGQRTDNSLYHVLHIDSLPNGKIPAGAKELSEKMKEYLQVPLFLPVHPDYINTVWASYMTSYARKVLREYCRNADGLVCYKDTDSVHVVGNIETGPDLGQMKSEFKQRTMTYRGPKFYFSSDSTDPPISKIRGVPTQLHREFIENGRVTTKRVVSLGVAKTRGMTLGDWYETVKTDHLQYPKRKPIEHVTTNGDYYLTKAYQKEELDVLLQEAPQPPHRWLL